MKQTPRVRQAGAVAFREKDKVLEVLLVRPSSGADEWVFPKGHIEPNELEHQAAEREALEEAGVQGLLVGAVDDVSRFLSKQEPVEVRYYILECLKQVDPLEARAQVWLPVALAAQALFHDDNRRVLSDALPLIDAHLRASGRGDSFFREFQLLELEQTIASLLKSEEDGERRVTVFLTLAAGAGAVLAFVLGNDRYAPQVVIWQIVLVLAALLVFGYFVLIRVVTRNHTSDRYKRKLKRIRRWLTPNLHDPRRPWVAFDPFEPASKRQLSYWGPKTGGWLEILILVNALLGGGLAAAIVQTTSWLAESSVAAVGGIVTWALLVARARHLMQRAAAEHE